MWPPCSTVGGMATAPVDDAAVRAFEARLFEILDTSAQAIFISMGHKAGLFGTMAGMPRASAEDIAKEAGLNERYVREWLDGMTVGGIVDYDPQDGTYTLPPERAKVLTGQDESCMAGHAQMIPLLAAIEPQIIEHFREGGGIPYAAYADLDWGVEVGNKDWDAAFIDDILPLGPGLVERLAAGADVADVGCGEGHKTNLMARAFPGSRFTGYDFLQVSIDAARAEAAEMGLTNITFEVRDVAELGLHESLDVLCVFDAVHDQARPRTVLRAIHEALRPDGMLFISEIRASSALEENVGRPLAAYLYLWSILQCMTVSLEQGGDGLGAMWGEQTARTYLTDAGFEVLTVARPPADPINSYFTCRRATAPA